MDDPFKNKTKKNVPPNKNKNKTKNPQTRKNKKANKKKAPIKLRETCSTGTNVQNPLERKALNTHARAEMAANINIGLRPLMQLTTIVQQINSQAEFQQQTGNDFAANIKMPTTNDAVSTFPRKRQVANRTVSSRNVMGNKHRTSRRKLLKRPRQTMEFPYTNQHRTLKQDKGRPNPGLNQDSSTDP